MQNLKNKFKYKNEYLYLEFEKYAADKSTAIMIRDKTGQPYATLTVRLRDAELEEGEFAVKTYSENEEISKAVFETGWFEDTGKKIQSGYVNIPIWRFK